MRFRFIISLFIGIACFLVQSSSAIGQAAAASVSQAGKKFVQAGFGNCIDSFGAWSVGAGQGFSSIQVVIKEVDANNNEVAVAGYPMAITATINGAAWSSPTYVNLPGPVAPALFRTYRVKVELRGTAAGTMQPVIKLAGVNSDFKF